MKMRRAVTPADIKQAAYINACANAGTYYDAWLAKQAAAPTPRYHAVISLWK